MFLVSRCPCAYSQAASLLPPSRLSGLILLNSAGAMNNKGVVSDWRIMLVYPLFLLIDLLLSIKPVAAYLFNSFRKKETIAKVLRSVYCNKESVDDELVDIIVAPSDHPNALDVFTSVITGMPSHCLAFCRRDGGGTLELKFVIC